MKSSDLVRAVKPVVETFEELGVAYYIGGSVGSSVYGVARTTIDVDVISNLNEGHIDKLVDRLKSDYYIDGEMIREAIQHHSSFNLIHLESMLKIDIFILKERLFDQQAFDRRKKELLIPEEAVQFFVASPEDIILNKLEWYKKGNQISERQWNDVLGVLKVQTENIDLKYLKHWANQLGVEDLLNKALSEVKSIF